MNCFNPELQFKYTESAINNKLIHLLSELKTVFFESFKKIEKDDKTKYNTFYFNSKAETINESNIDDVIESTYSAVISNIQKSLEKGPVWIIDSFIDHNVNISKYNPLADNS